ncbi:tetratricopeptide repeat protein [Pleurocapsa sp. PCC 7319]|uniref:tetratricopeptide repeat protein n=1 Tax=Pleurocapsa sp. PCC 7319 TaxID=118161 RepID=UPI00034DC068|nr:tetratricopeptide repeat protein [Pleurocapsa sp. PCC 7319]
MSNSENNIPLGAVLQLAGLVSHKQLQHALQQQSQSNDNLRIGEILASQGSINSKTANFFAEQWPTLVAKKKQQPIGQYFKQAALLTEQQIQIILAEQMHTQLKFGELAIAKGWLKEKTVDFFLRYLASDYKHQNHTTRAITKNSEPKILNSINQLDYSQKIHEQFLKIKYKLLKLEDQNAYSEKVFKKVLFWTGGQSVLTQRVFRLIADNQSSNSQDHIAQQVDYLVKTKIIHDWENQESGQHLIAIKSRLLKNQQCESSKLLKLYQRVLEEEVLLDDSQEQQELINIGLLVKQGQKLIVANRIYQSVFNRSWVQKELDNLTNHNISAIAIVPENSTAVVPVSKSRPSFFQPRTILLLLALISLLSIFLNIMSKRIAVKTAFQKGNELLKQGDFEPAILEYNRLLKVDSNYFQAWTNRGYALAGLKQYDEMRESCSTATIIEPKALYAWNCQGEALHNLKRENEAVTAFETAISLNKKEPIFLINKSESLNALGKYEESVAAIEKSIQILEELEAAKGKKAVSTEFAIALTYLGNSYRRRKQYAMALMTYNRALEYTPNYFAAQIGKGIVLTQAKRYQEARKEFTEILDNEQLTEAKQAQTWFYLGKTLCDSQLNPEAGIDAFEQAIQLRSDYDAAVEAKNRCY